MLAASARIGEEIKAIRPASGRPAKIAPISGEQLNGRQATGVQKNIRSKLGKLAAIPKNELKSIAIKIQKAGGDATVSAVLRELKSEDIKDKRAAYG